MKIYLSQLNCACLAPGAAPLQFALVIRVVLFVCLVSSSAARGQAPQRPSDRPQSDSKETKESPEPKKTGVPPPNPAPGPAEATNASGKSSAGPAAPPSSSAPTGAVKTSSTKTSGLQKSTLTANDSTVWVNTATGAYHKKGSRWYGKTKKGKYMTEADAIRAGYHAAGAEQR